MTTGVTRLNTVRQSDLTRPEIDDMKVRIHRLEVQEITTPRTAGLVKMSVASGELLTIPSGYQYIVAEEVDIVGELDVYGELVII